MTQADARKIEHRARTIVADLEGRTEVTAARLHQAAKEAGYWVSGDGRIGESDLAKLLGITPASLANKRRDGSGPKAFTLAGGGHRITYRLDEVAAWIEAHRE